VALTKLQLLDRLQAVRRRQHGTYCDYRVVGGSSDCTCGKTDEEYQICRELTKRYGKFWQRAGA